MNKMKSSNLLLALSLTVMLAACGKSMSLQVAGQSSKAGNQTPSIIDTTRVAAPDAGNNQALTSLSKYDLEELKGQLNEGSLAKRVTMQIYPIEAVKEVIAITLTLNKAEISDAKNATLCIVETECRPLSAFITDPAADKIEIDLLKVFGLTGKTSAEVMNWVYNNSTKFADPSYRKFRFTFEGITSLESGSLNLQFVTNDKLPANFVATVATCYEHGTEDAPEVKVEEVKPEVKPETTGTDGTDAIQATESPETVTTT